MSGAQMQQMKKAKLDDGVVKRQLAMLSSMTAGERKKPDLIKASRKQRIAAGSGTTVQDVNKLLKQHKDANRIMKRVQKMGKKGMLRGGLRSEEHTSELQSLMRISYAVFCLKKKNKKRDSDIYNNY